MTRNQMRYPPSIHWPMPSYQDDGTNQIPPSAAIYHAPPPPSRSASLRPASVRTPPPLWPYISGSVSITPPPSQPFRPWPPPIGTVYQEQWSTSPCLPSLSILDVTDRALSSPHTPRSSILQSKLLSALRYLSLPNATSFDGVLMIGLVPLVPLPYPINIGDEPA